MKFKFELDIGANEVIRLNREAHVAGKLEAFRKQFSGGARTTTPPDAVRTMVREMVDKLKAQSAEVHFVDSDAEPLASLFADIGKPKTKAELDEFAKKHNLPSTAELMTMFVINFDGGAPGQKPGQDAQVQERAVIGSEDFGALLYALEMAIPAVGKLGDAGNQDLAGRLMRLRALLKGSDALAKASEAAKAAE